MHFARIVIGKLPPAVVLVSLGWSTVAQATLNCAPEAAHELNRQDQRLCAAGLEKLDVQLNASYKAAIERLKDEAQRAQLRNEQRAWIQARNRCETKDCFVQAYEQRIRQLDGSNAQELANANVKAGIPLSDIRQVVEGSMVGFVQPKDGQPVPAQFLAPDGKPDMVFLPNIKGQQDADLKLASGESRTFETFFGRRQFKATLLTKKIDGNFYVLGIKLPDATEWPLKSFFSYPRPKPSDDRVDVGPSAIDSGPVFETFNKTCDPPGDSGAHLRWKTTQVSLDRQFVVRLPWREYPCQGPREEPSTDSHWRRYIGIDPLIMGDQRDGAFAFIWIRPVWPQHAGIKVTPMSEVTYLLHLDSRRQYAPVEMVTPELMLLDISLLRPFRERVKADFDQYNKEVDDCRDRILERRPAKRRLTPDEIAVQDKELAKCKTRLDSPGFSESQFIQSFVPERWRQLWAN